MEKVVKIGHGFQLNRVILKIIKQQADITAKTAFELYKLHKNLDEMEEFVFSRIALIYGDNISAKSIINMDNPVCNAIMESETLIEIPKIDINEILKSDKIKLEIDDIEILNKIFDF